MTAIPASATAQLDTNGVFEWASTMSSCDADPNVLAAIAEVVSDTGKANGSRIDFRGDVTPPLIGTADLRPDTDFGEIDGNDETDLPVGPFQFMPDAWIAFGYDANTDGTTNPHNMWDAAASAAEFLCAHQTNQPDPMKHAIRMFAGSDQQAKRITQTFTKRERHATQRPNANPDIIIELPASTIDTVSSADGIGLLDIDSDGTVETVTFKLNKRGVLRATATTGDGRFSKRVGRAGDIAVVGDWDGDTKPDFGVFRTVDNKPWFVLSGDQRIQTGNQVAIQPFVGDWNGDGQDTPATLDPRTGQFTKYDQHGNTYGTTLTLPKGTTYQTLIGDWDGDNIDTIALHKHQSDAITHINQRGNIDTIQQVDPAATLAVTTQPPQPAQIDPVAAAVPVKVQPVEERGTIRSVNDQEIEIVRVAGITVAASIGAQLQQLHAAATTDGITIEGWGLRTHQRQIELREQNCPDIWEAPPSTCHPPTAIPGTSRHETGQAIDFHTNGTVLTRQHPTYIWLTEHAQTYGFYNLPSEPWHWSTDGK